MGILGGRVLNELLSRASVEAVQVAAEWLADYMIQLVDVQCGAATRHPSFPWEKDKNNRVRSEALDRQHAPEGKPPFKETGAGQATIGWMRMSDGAVVGVEGMDHSGLPAGNYMAGWDSEEGIRGRHHPWLRTFFTNSGVREEFAQRIREAMQESLR
jgi:hypothetical protein